MTITVYKQKLYIISFLNIQNNFQKKKKNSENFFLQNHEMRPKIESQNSEDHEL